MSKRIFNQILTIQLGVKSCVLQGYLLIYNLADDLFLLFGDIKLIEPADDFDVVTIGIGDCAAEAASN